MSHLLDTNILIYYFGKDLGYDVLKKLEDYFSSSFNISAITKIEFLGWKGHTENGFKRAFDFLNFANVLPISDSVVERTIELKRKYSIRLADAIIAATAIENGLTLLTRNTEDFSKIKKLALFNPFGG